MSRNGSGVYSLPGTYQAVTGETVEAQQHNDPLEDLEADANTARPIVAGGTGATTAADARTSLAAAGLDDNNAFSGNNTFYGANTFSGVTSGVVPTGTVLPFAGFAAPTGFLLLGSSAVSRTTYDTLFGILTRLVTATKGGTATLSSVSVDLTSYGFVGAYVEGTGIASGTTIVSLTSTTITLSAIPSGSGNIAIRILPFGQGDGSATFDLPQVGGRVIAGREATASRLTTSGSGISGDALGAGGGSQSTTLVTGNLPPYTPAGSVAVSPNSNVTTWNGNSLSADLAGTSFAMPDANNMARNPVTATFTGTAQGGTSTPFSRVQPTIVMNYIIKY